MKGTQNLFLRNGDYESMFTEGPPKTVAVVWRDSEKTKFMGFGSGSIEAELERRKCSCDKQEDHGKRTRLATEIAVDYNRLMGGVDNCDHLRNIRTVRRRSAKPYIPIFYWVIDTALTNAWCYYKRMKHHETQKRGSRLKFHESIAISLGNVALSTNQSKSCY